MYCIIFLATRAKFLHYRIRNNMQITLIPLHNQRFEVTSVIVDGITVYLSFFPEVRAVSRQY